MNAQGYAANAVRWALERLGDPSYATRCLGFLEDAYEIANRIEVFGEADAQGTADAYGVLPLGDAPPSEGAYVFYACGGPVAGVRQEWGHVGLSLGDGRLVHAWDVVRVDPIDAIERLDPPTGWDAPRLLGWTPPERVLRGHRLVLPS
jgi:cell wall-associated NlpC family hydrolase